MSFKRVLSSALALSLVVSSFSVVNVFAGEPTFKVGTPIDISTSTEVTELQAGQCIEVPIDVENVDSGKLSMMQLEMYYDNTVFDPGVSAANVLTYYNNNKSALAISNKKLVARSNMKADSLGIGVYEPTGVVSGNTTASANSMTALWTIDGADSIDVNADEPEIYMLFTVKSDFDASTFDLNSANNNNTVGLATDSLFALDCVKVDETTTINHFAPSGTQNEMKINPCVGAFQVTIDNSQLPYYVKSLTAQLGDDTTKTANLTVYTNEDGSSTYVFPARITSYSGTDESATVKIYADAYSDEACTESLSSQLIATKTISMNSTVTSYENADATYSNN